MAWDMRYRPLKEGEIIRPTDDVQEDDGTWRAGCRCADHPAPDPAYTSHRVYRRLIRSNDSGLTYNGHSLADLAKSGTYHPGDDA